jgi:hypothetical protein
MAKKAHFGSTESEARKVMNEFRKTMGMPPIKPKKKKRGK